MGSKSGLTFLRVYRASIERDDNTSLVGLTVLSVWRNMVTLMVDMWIVGEGGRLFLTRVDKRNQNNVITAIFPTWSQFGLDREGHRCLLYITIPRSSQVTYLTP